MPSTLRPALPADHALITAWLPDASATAHWAGPAVRHPLRSYEWDKLLDEAEGSSYVLLDDDEPVAFGQSPWAGPDSLAWQRLLVRPDRRRQGCARALCTLLVDIALAEPGVRAIALQVLPQDIAARNLFSRFGFQGQAAAAAAAGDARLTLRRMLRRPSA